MKTNITENLETLSDISVLHFDDKATVMSAYKLAPEELQMIKKAYPVLKDVELVNEVDPHILSGIIIKSGTQLVDLTLNGALQNLRKQIYESN